MDPLERRRRLPNVWRSQGIEVRASVRVQRALRPRLAGGALAGPSGTWPLRQKYYDSESKLVRALVQARRRGADVIQELNALGSVHVRTRERGKFPSGYRQLTPREAFCLAFPRPDTSPHHLGEAREEGAKGVASR